MKLKECLSFYFKERSRIKAEIAQQAASHLILHLSGSIPLVERHLSHQSKFCLSLVSNGYLTQEQMKHAALCYRLGMSRDGGVIFWQIDQIGQIYDGKIMYYMDNCHRDKSHKPTWALSELKKFCLKPEDPLNYELSSSHCLFGTHLLSMELTPAAVVESEKTAIILSEHYPNYIWLATGGLEALRPEVLYPLKDRDIILFPDTDETGDTFRKWYTIAQSAQRLLGQPIRVSPFLEQNATLEQKQRKIDLADYILENR